MLAAIALYGFLDFLWIVFSSILIDSRNPHENCRTPWVTLPLRCRLEDSFLIINMKLHTTKIEGYRVVYKASSCLAISIEVKVAAILTETDLLNI